MNRLRQRPDVQDECARRAGKAAGSDRAASSATARREGLGIAVPALSARGGRPGAAASIAAVEPESTAFAAATVLSSAGEDVAASAGDISGRGGKISDAGEDISIAGGEALSGAPTADPATVAAASEIAATSAIRRR